MARTSSAGVWGRVAPQDSPNPCPARLVRSEALLARHRPIPCKRGWVVEAEGMPGWERGVFPARQYGDPRRL